MSARSGDIDLPVIRFLGNDVWEDVDWSGTAFRWHSTSEAPPVMGLVFENASAARSLFSDWIALAGNQDLYEELRVTIVEGELGDARPGYIVHLCPDPENTLAHATAEGVVFDVEQFAGLCRAQKMDFLADAPPMLARFKAEYAKHGEFLLAPVIKRKDGRPYFDVNLGIIKRKIHFLAAEDILAELKAQGLDVELIAKLMLERGEGPADSLSN